VAFRSLRVTDFGGKSLSTLAVSSWEIDPNLPEAEELRQWLAQQNIQSMKPKSLSQTISSSSNIPRKTIFEVREEKLGQGDQVLLPFPLLSFSSLRLLVAF